MYDGYMSSEADTGELVHKIISGLREGEWREGGGEGGEIIWVACKGKTEVGKVKYEENKTQSSS
jgi:hypothetical protein